MVILIEAFLPISSKISEWSNWLLPQLFLYYPKTAPKLYIHEPLIHHINLQFFYNYIFYIHSLVKTVILKRSIDTVLIFKFGCANLH